jgi:hypothetical protein
MDTKRIPRCSIRVQVSETRVASEKSGREMMTRKRTILCLALLASTAACGGGGGGGGGGGASSTTGGGGTGSMTPPPAVGSTQFGNPSVVMTNNGTATMASKATAQSVQMTDGEVPDANTPGGFDHKDLLVVNINDGGVTFVGPGNAACKPGSGCQTTGHVFDLTNDVEGTPGQNSAPGTAVNGFPGVGFTGNGQPTFATANFPHDPTFMTATDLSNPNNTVTFDSSLSFSLYGIWEGTDDTTKQPVVGAFATAGEGSQAAPFSSLPKTGTAVYIGKALAVANTGGNITHLDGTSDFNANFATMMLSATVNLTNAQTGAAFSTLNYAPASIVAGTGGQAAVGSSVTSADGKLAGTAQTTFFGAANPAQGTIPPEIGSTFSVSGGGTSVVGAAGGALKH